MFPTFKVSIAFKQLKKDILGNIVGIGAIAQVRQGDSKHDIPVIFDRLSKCLFFHNHLPVTVMILDEVLTIDTLWPDEMFQIQAGKTYQNKPVPYWQKESPSVRGGGFPERAARCLSLLLYSPAQDGKHIKCFPLRAELATNLTPALSPGDPPCRHIIQPVLRACAAARLARVLLGGVGLMDLVELRPLAQRKTGDALCIPRFCCG